MNDAGHVDFKAGKKNPASQAPPDDSPTMRAYRMRCVIEGRKKPVHDDSIKGGKVDYQSQMVYLVPDSHSGDTDMCLSAWLPEEEGEEHYHEVPAIIPALGAAVRLSVHRSAPLMPRPHFFVMTEHISHELWRRFKSFEHVPAKRTIEVKILPADEEGALG